MAKLREKEYEALARFFRAAKARIDAEEEVRLYGSHRGRADAVKVALSAERDALTAAAEAFSNW